MSFASPSFYFLGTYSYNDLLTIKNPRPGSIVIDPSTNNTYVFIDNWELLETDITEEKPTSQRRYRLILHCNRCGAPLDISDQAKLNGYVKCKYCESNVEIYDYSKTIEEVR